MSKVIVRVKNNNLTSYERKGILDEKRNILIYDDLDGIRNVLDFKHRTLIRKNENSKIILNFNINNNANIKIYSKISNEELIIPIKLINFEICDTSLNIVYFVDDVEKIEFQIEIVKF